MSRLDTGKILKIRKMGRSLPKRLRPSGLAEVLAVLLLAASALFSITGSGRASGAPGTYSTAYSPYRTYEILSEVSGRIVSWGAEEGQILPAGRPLVEIEHEALSIEARELEIKLRQLLQEEKNLRRIVSLKEKKLERYRGLLKQGHLQPQAVEDVEVDFLSFRMKLIQNRKQQADTRRAIAGVRDQLKKSMPSFDIPLYLSQRYKERYENLLPGQKIARLMDISRARAHLVLPPLAFKSLRQTLAEGASVRFYLILPYRGQKDGDQGQTAGAELSTRVLTGRVERLKVDRDNDYLYSYGFDLVFEPQPDILWGEVVAIRLAEPEEPSSRTGHGQ